MDDGADRAQRIFEELKAGLDVDENFRQLFDLYHHRLRHFYARRGLPDRKSVV